MTASAAEPVSVQIFDKEYLVACPADERDDLIKAAALLNSRLKEMRDSSKVVGTDRLLMMAALNMANELGKLQSRESRSQAQMGGRVKAMRERVERALVHGQQLEL
jgi:cell division protein ZapA